MARAAAVFLLTAAVTVGIVCTAALPGTVRAQVAVPGSAAVTITSITPTDDTTPDYQVGNAKAKPFQPGKWLEVEVEFAVPPPGAPELRFRYFVLVGKQLLVGEVTHVNVSPGAGRFSVMYVAPRALARLLGGQPFTVAAVQNVEVQIFRPGTETPLADKQLKPGPALAASDLPPTRGLLLNKDETPFAPLYYDRYEEIKADR